MVSSEINCRFQPELGFTLGARSMDMRSAFLPGKEKEPVAFPFEYRRTHADAFSFSLSTLANERKNSMAAFTGPMVCLLNNKESNPPWGYGQI
jgi:hypothetical protein